MLKSLKIFIHHDQVSFISVNVEVVQGTVNQLSIIHYINGQENKNHVSHRTENVTDKIQDPFHDNNQGESRDDGLQDENYIKSS